MLLSDLPLLVQDVQLQGEPVGNACGFTTAYLEPAASTLFPIDCFIDISIISSRITYL